jgi:predicted metal-dependent peptidase
MTTTRPLTRDEQHAFTSARLGAVNCAPYLAAALFQMRAVAAPGLGTFAVDRHWRLYLDPDALASWGPVVSSGVLVHEVSHLIRDHATRATQLGDHVDHLRWNLATDAAINDGLLESGVPLPEGVVTPAILDLPDGGIEESYYNALPPCPPDDQPGCGSGAGDPAAEWELPANDSSATAVTDARAQIVRQAVAQAIDAHTGPGTLPATWQRWADLHTATPTPDWRAVLAASLRRAVAYVRGNTDWTYSKPGRRRIPDVLTPAMRTPTLSLAVVTDTSGSMTQAHLDAALAQVREILSTVAVTGRAIRVIACDAEVAATSRVRTAADVNLAGGGGTDMRVGIDAAAAQRPAPDVIVVLTDGDTPWPQKPTRQRLVVALIGDGIDPRRVPSWATAVCIPLTALR